MIQVWRKTHLCLAAILFLALPCLSFADPVDLKDLTFKIEATGDTPSLSALINGQWQNLGPILKLPAGTKAFHWGNPEDIAYWSKQKKGISSEDLNRLKYEYEGVQKGGMYASLDVMDSKSFGSRFFVVEFPQETLITPYASVQESLCRQLSGGMYVNFNQLTGDLNSILEKTGIQGSHDQSTKTWLNLFGLQGLKRIRAGNAQDIYDYLDSPALSHGVLPSNALHAFQSNFFNLVFEYPELLSDPRLQKHYPEIYKIINHGLTPLEKNQVFESMNVPSILTENCAMNRMAKLSLPLRKFCTALRSEFHQELLQNIQRDDLRENILPDLLSKPTALASHMQGLFQRSIDLERALKKATDFGISLEDLIPDTLRPSLSSHSHPLFTPSLLGNQLPEPELGTLASGNGAGRLFTLFETRGLYNVLLARSNGTLIEASLSDPNHPESKFVDQFNQAYWSWGKRSETLKRWMGSWGESNPTVPWPEELNQDNYGAPTGSIAERFLIKSYHPLAEQYRLGLIKMRSDWSSEHSSPSIETVPIRDTSQMSYLDFRNKVTQESNQGLLIARALLGEGKKKDPRPFNLLEIWQAAADYPGSPKKAEVFVKALQYRFSQPDIAAMIQRQDFEAVRNALHQYAGEVESNKLGYYKRKSEILEEARKKAHF